MKKSFIFFLLSIVWINLFGQVSIGNPNSPPTNVILDLTNGDSDGLLLPKTSTPPTSPVGNIIFDSTYNMLSLVDTSGKVNLLSPWNYDPSAELIIYLKDGLNVGVGTSIPNTKLHIIGSSPASKLGGGGFFKLGGNDQHIVMDNTKIISKSNGFTESDLQLQEEGHLNVGNHFTTDVQDNTPNLSGPVPSGGIIMWSGSSNNIPAGWKLCDGSDGTPNLSGRFVVGIGNNGETSYQSNEMDGSDNVSLSIPNLPSHNHAGNTGTEGSHEHIYKDRFYIENNAAIDNANDMHSSWNMGPVTQDGGSWPQHNDGMGSGDTDGDNNSYLYTFGKTSSGTLSPADKFSNGTTLNNHSNSAVHSHSISSQGNGTSFSNKPKYFALAFIMKK